MVTQQPVTARILRTVKHTPGCDLDTLAKSLPEFTWNQVFLEIDRLSRLGEVLVTFGTEGRFMLRLPEHKKGSATPQVRP
ncbi:MAG TPA: hypothetical protein VKP13_12690 [Nitrospira sp.]|nr:hypothetical protein [Nitrospira sp.]